MALGERTMLTGIAGWRATLVCGSMLFSLANPVCNLRRIGHSCLGTFGTPCVCCVILSLPPPLIQWDTPRRPLWLLQFIVVCTQFSDVFSTTSVLCGLRRRQRTQRPHKLVSELVGGFSSVETDRQLDTKQFGEWETNEREKKFCDVENHFTGIQD